MSGWIKVEKDLSNDPRVLRMASRMRHADVTLGSRSRLVVVGALVTLWWYADTHIREDDTLPIGSDQVNELVGVEGFCDLMPVEWLEVLDANNVKLVDYTAHNGTTAKKRALGQRRKERSRSRHADVTQESRSCLSNSVTRPRPRLDQDLDKNKKEEEEPRSVELKLDGGPVDRVFAHWRSEFRHPKATLDPKRRKSIQRALEAYDEDTLKASISGYLLSPHHMGQNDQRTVYDDICLFLRDAEHIERGMNFARAPPVRAMSAVEIAQQNLRKVGGANGSVVAEQDGNGEGHLVSVGRVLR